jgi:hypothetical protein
MALSLELCSLDQDSNTTNLNEFSTSKHIQYQQDDNEHEKRVLPPQRGQAHHGMEQEFIA